MDLTIRRTGLALLTVPAVMLLSGCLSISSVVAVNSDATASGEFSLEVARQPAALLGIASAETLNGALRDSGQADFTSPTDCVASEDEAFLRLTCPFEDQAFTDPTDWLLIQREGDEITISVRNEGQSNDSMDIPLGTFSFEVQTPGPIRSITGAYGTQTGDNTARVVASMNDPVEVVITSAATGSGLPSWLAVVVSAAAALALIGIAVLLIVLLRRRKGRASDVVSNGESADGPPPSDVSAVNPPGHPSVRRI